MAEYIPKDKAVEACFYGWNNNAHDCAENIRSIPADDVRPVVRGKWALFGRRGIYGVMYECSACHAKYDGRTNFCPNCGADMREKTDG